TGARLTYDSHTQVMKLSSEINCLHWASALMGLVYDHINSYQKTNGPAPLAIPQMCFVGSVLAIAEDSHDAFLLKEVIDDTANGAFVKYIGNGFAKPYSFLEGDHVRRAEFLSFSQHLQYLKTDGLAFVSDFQGGHHLLTDPQLITSPDLGSIFSDGNLSSAYISFTSDHTCNKFCELFGL
ncbi:hypothetical protein BU17DRAFT_24227, partial [Hysterangium stoloniferum]